MLKIPKEFLEQYAAALRMEPDSRTDDLENGIAAKTADPLWYLTRQWQVNEFEGEDAGSPIDVDLNYQIRPLNTAKLRNDDGDIISNSNKTSDSLPIEILVEQEWLQIDWKVSAQIGQLFEQQIHILIPERDRAMEYIQSYRDKYTFQFNNEAQEADADEESRRFVKFMKGRIVNGKKIVNHLNFANASLVLPTDGVGLQDETLQSIGRYLLKWCQAMNIRSNPERSKAWRNEQLDYHFRLDSSEDNSTDERTLIAPEYRSGNVDWYTFDAYSDMHKEVNKWTDHTLESKLPTPINIMGISSRWWEFEDANIDFGHLEVGKVDIARSLLMQNVLVYGDDWYSLPLPVPVSSFTKISSLTVKNVFGDKKEIKPAYYQNDPADPIEQFRLFTLSAADEAALPPSETAPVLYMPAVLTLKQESSPLEKAKFIRDEWSNMVWCVEDTVLNGVGKPVDGYKAQIELLESKRDAKVEKLLTEIQTLKEELASLQLEDTEHIDIQNQLEFKVLELKELLPEHMQEESSIPKYRLASTVPENWIPFQPFDASNVFGGEKQIRLRRAQMLRNIFDEEPEEIPAKTRLLEISENPLLWMEESVIPRSGLRVTLNNQRIRWMDGRTFVWKGRKILTGQGEGQSGLIFDKLVGI